MRSLKPCSCKCPPRWGAPDMHHDEQKPDSAGRALLIHDEGVRGISVEPGPGYLAAQQRHARVLQVLDDPSECARLGLTQGALTKLSLAANDLVLDGDSLDVATSSRASAYCHGGKVFVEWTTPAGGLDRRQVSDRTAQLALLNRGFVVRPSDSNRAIAALRCIYAQTNAMSLETFLGDCQAWWYPRTNRPLFAHALGLRPFELLPRACLARLFSGKPQAPSAQTRVEIDDDLGTYLVLGRGDGKTDTFDELLAFARDVAADNGSKDDGRRKVIERISMLLPAAAREGLAQILVLAGTRHALRAGGIRGTLWAPTTTADYLGAGMKRLLSTLVSADPNQMDGAQWHAAYSEVLALVSESARTKFGAYLQVFHRFLVLLGMEPLSQPLPGSARTMLPAATVVWEHELERAIDYVVALAPSERVGLQAQAVLRLGYHVPVRTAEFLCLRVGDVSCASGVSVVIYPRRRDGVSKSFSVRRIEDIDDFELQRVLIQMVRLRRADGAEGEDVLLGQPGPGEVRHQPGATMALVNNALRWATGDRGASVYDLRHACFSRRAALVLGGNHVI